MTNLIRLDPSPRWPYSLAQLRIDEPQLSFSAEPHDSELAALAELGIMVARIQSAPRPTDSREQRAKEQPPEPDGNSWRQRWTLRAATAEELAAWDAVHAPAPDWPTFKATALNSATLNQILAAAYEAVPVAAGALAPALLRAEGNGADDFAAAWSAICAAVPVPAEVVSGFQQTARACHLPAAFVEALRPAGFPVTENSAA